MLIKRETLDAIVAGAVTLAFRRWRRPTVRAGGRLRTVVGELSIVAVDAVDEKKISTGDARRAGFASRQALLEELASRGSGSIYRIELRFDGADPRIALRAKANLTNVEREEIASRLERFDAASRRGSWTETALNLIEKHPARRAPELAEMAGHDTAWFKRNIRKLKELGLTESLEVGYRLSPRGRAFRKK